MSNNNSVSDRRRFMKQLGAGAAFIGLLPMKPLFARTATQALVDTKFMGQRGMPASFLSPHEHQFPCLSAQVPSTVVKRVLRGSRIRWWSPERERLWANDPVNGFDVCEFPIKLVVSGPTFTVQVQGKDKLSYKLENPDDAHWFVRAFCALALDNHWRSDTSCHVDALLQSRAVGCGVLRPPAFEIPDHLARTLVGANTVVTTLIQRLNLDIQNLNPICQRMKVLTERLERHMKRPNLLGIWRSDWVNWDLEPGDCRAVVFANFSPDRTKDERDTEDPALLRVLRGYDRAENSLAGHSS